MPAFNILEFIPTHFCRCARSIVVLHMALFEVVLETRLKKKKNGVEMSLHKLSGNRAQGGFVQSSYRQPGVGSFQQKSLVAT